MLPSVIYEDRARLFNFYHDGMVRQGMSYKSRLYKLVNLYDFTCRSQAYCLACQFTSLGVETVITASGQIYKVWVEVSAPLVAEPEDRQGCPALKEKTCLNPFCDYTAKNR